MKMTVKKYKKLTERDQLKHLNGTGITLSGGQHYPANGSFAIPIEDVVKAINEKRDEEDGDEDQREDESDAEMSQGRT